jgi:DNA-binding winged helix-turn-helix (wHTH) protein
MSRSAAKRETTPRGLFGRDRELSLLHEMMHKGGPRVVHIHGVSGIGKSALIRAFAEVERSRRGTVCLLDGREFEPTERGFLHELSRRLRIERPTLRKISRALSAVAKPVLIVLDSYELLGLLDAWLRQSFMVGLKENVRLILVSRFSPSPQWSEAPEWRGEFRSFQLQPISESAALELLASLGTDPSSIRELAKFAHGHPLALVIGGAAAMRLPSVAGRTPHTAISTLAHRFLEEVEDPQLREALRAASVARRVTRSLLRALMPDRDDDSLFDRLTRIPFIEPARDGLIIHDAAREAIRADLEAIDPKAFQRYRRAAWQQLAHEAKSAATLDLWRYTADLIFLIDNPVVREAFFPRDVAQFYVERAGTGDAAAILDIAAAHDGDSGARIIERWRKHLPQAFYVIRDAHAEVEGFYCLFDPRDAAPSLFELDPLASSWARHLRRSPLPKGQTALFLRRWLSREHGEAPSPVQAAAWLDIKRHYMERRPFLQRIYLALKNFAPYEKVASALGIHVVDDLAAYIGDARFSGLELDMGPRSVNGWLARLAATELGAEQDGLLDERSRSLILCGRTTKLTRKEFELMRYLTLREGEAVTRIELLNDVWGLKYNSGGNVVDAIVASLRKKLGAFAEVIETVHGHGYLYKTPRTHATTFAATRAVVRPNSRRSSPFRVGHRTLPEIS